MEPEVLKIITGYWVLANKNVIPGLQHSIS